MSKAKGARFELEVAHYFQSNGYPEAHRTAQHCGKTGDAGDVEGIAGLHIECKRVQVNERVITEICRNRAFGDYVDRKQEC